MSVTVSARDFDGWNQYNLSDYGDYAECVEEREVRTYNDDTTSGMWFYRPDALVTDVQGQTWRVLYTGTWGNYNAPGAWDYTQAVLYDPNDPDDLNEYQSDVKSLVSAPRSVDEE